MKQRSIIIAMLYGASRKLHQLSGDPKVSSTVYDTETGKRHLKNESLYTSTKAFLIAFGAVASIYGWPYFVAKDIHTFEAFCRGDKTKTPEDDLVYLFN